MLHNGGKTRSTADTEGLCNVSQILNIAFEKACNKRMTFKDTQGHHN